MKLFRRWQERPKWLDSGARYDGIGRSTGELVIIGSLVFFVTILILLMSGAPPLAAFYHILKGSLGSWTKIAQVLTAWIPLTLCAAGLLFSFRVGLWNIGVEGQVVAGAIAATAVMKLGVSLRNTFDDHSVFPLLRPFSREASGPAWQGF